MFRERGYWRDAEQRGSKDLILRSGASRVSKDEATELKTLRLSFRFVEKRLPAKLRAACRWQAPAA
jgi:hypothetical protein